MYADNDTLYVEKIDNNPKFFEEIPVDYFEVHSAEELGISERLRKALHYERQIWERKIMHRDNPESYAEMLRKEAEERELQEKKECMEKFGITEEEYDELMKSE